MLETLLEWDKIIFEFINQTFTNGFFDWLLPYLRNKYIWVPLYIFFLSFFWINYRLEGFIVSLFIILTIVISDQTSSSFVKHAVERLRPCNAPDFQSQVRLLVDCGGGYSFTSSHATNHFAFSAVLASILGSKFRWIPPVFYTWAFLVSYSQVYVGVHYPLDIVGGAILGIIIGKLMGMIAKMFTGFRP